MGHGSLTWRAVSPGSMGFVRGGSGWARRLQVLGEDDRVARQGVDAALASVHRARAAAQVRHARRVVPAVDIPGGRDLALRLGEFDWANSLSPSVETKSFRFIECQITQSTVIVPKNFPLAGPGCVRFHSRAATRARVVNETNCCAATQTGRGSASV